MLSAAVCCTLLCIVSSTAACAARRLVHRLHFTVAMVLLSCRWRLRTLRNACCTAARCCSHTVCNTRSRGAGGGSHTVHRRCAARRPCGRAACSACSHVACGRSSACGCCAAGRPLAQARNFGPAAQPCGARGARRIGGARATLALHQAAAILQINAALRLEQCCIWLRDQTACAVQQRACALLAFRRHGILACMHLEDRNIPDLGTACQRRHTTPRAAACSAQNRSRQDSATAAMGTRQRRVYGT